jgi:carbon monoxide dehydrogenase subunit G
VGETGFPPRAEAEGGGGVEVKIENAFDVPVPPERAWDLLMDVPRVIPCMPGATLTDTVDDANWKADVSVKLGPISLAFDTNVRREEADESVRRARLSARARESRGRGAATAIIESRLTTVDGGTHVDVVTDLQLSGAVAQFGRGIVPDVAEQMVQSFAECLRKQLVAARGEAQVAVVEQYKPIGGLRLGLGAIWRRITRIFQSERRG